MKFRLFSILITGLLALLFISPSFALTKTGELSEYYNDWATRRRWSSTKQQRNKKTQHECCKKMEHYRSRTNGQKSSGSIGVPDMSW